MCAPADYNALAASLTRIIIFLGCISIAPAIKSFITGTLNRFQKIGFMEIRCAG